MKPFSCSTSKCPCAYTFLQLFSVAVNRLSVFYILLLVAFYSRQHNNNSKITCIFYVLWLSLIQLQTYFFCSSPFFKQQQEQKRRKWPQKMSLKYRFNDFQLLLWSNCALLWLKTSPFWDLLWYFLLLFTVLAPGLLLNYLLAIPPQWSVLLNNDKANCLPWTNLAKNLTFLSLNINWFFFPLPNYNFIHYFVPWFFPMVKH